MRSLSNYDGEVNENGKKSIDLDKQNNNFAGASRFFVRFSAVVARLQRETFQLNLTFSRERGPKTALSLYIYIYIILTVNHWSCLMSVVLQFGTIRNSTVAIKDQWLYHIYTYVFFWTYRQSLEFNQEKKGNIWQIELDGIRATNFETVQLTF